MVVLKWLKWVWVIWIFYNEYLIFNWIPFPPNMSSFFGLSPDAKELDVEIPIKSNPNLKGITGSMNWKDYALVIIADPQITDAYSYSNNGPLVTWLAELYSDVFMKRAFRQGIASKMSKSSHHVLFLGDLFDGGREWFDENGIELAEYERDFNRFNDIFLSHLPTPEDGQKKLFFVAGNHDIGAGTGISPDAVATWKRDFYHNLDYSISTYIDLGEDQGVALIDYVIVNTLIFANKAKSNDNDDNDDNKDELQPQHNNHHHHDELIAYETREFMSKYSRASEAASEKILFSHIPLFREAGTACSKDRKQSVSITEGEGYQVRNACVMGKIIILYDSIKMFWDWAKLI